MKLSLMTALAFPLATTIASEEWSWGTDKSFPAAAVLDNVAVAVTDDRPSYCFMPPPRPTCYRDGYPKCCNQAEGDCPEGNPPGCECDGDCTAEVACLFPNENECANKEFCMISPGDCRLRSATVSGICTGMPEMCPASYAPVCGCDGETYSNSCAAAGAGINVEYAGKCRNDNKRPERRTCLYPNDGDCHDNEFCKVSTGDCRKRSANISGTCVAKTKPCNMSHMPVCGCDGETYSNSCAADAKGVNVIHTGECTGPPAPAPGSSFCTWSPDKDCYKKGWPKCCVEDDQPCPPDYQPRCDKLPPGGDYCAWKPDDDCYPSSGRPACCERFRGTNCPTDKPNCEKKPTEHSEDGTNVKFLRNVQ